MWRGTRATEAEEWWLARREGAESVAWSNAADSEGSAYAYLTSLMHGSLGRKITQDHEVKRAHRVQGKIELCRRYDSILMAVTILT